MPVLYHNWMGIGRLVNKILKEATPGQMIVVKGKNQGLMFVVTAGFDGSSIAGYQPIYMSETYKLSIGDFLRIINKDNPTMALIPEKNVEPALDAMFGMAVNFQK